MLNLNKIIIKINLDFFQSQFMISDNFMMYAKKGSDIAAFAIQIFI